MLSPGMKYPPWVILIVGILSIIMSKYGSYHHGLFSFIAGFSFGSSIMMFVINYKESR